MAADVKAFIRKWHGRTLDDDGCHVSKEFHSFQVAFFNAMRKIAKSLGGEVVNPSYGHYDMSGFVKRGDRYVYFSYSNCCGCGGRTHVTLKETSVYSNEDCCNLLIRTAANEEDYSGGTNNYSSFETCEEMINKLLNMEHRKAF